MIRKLLAAGALAAALVTSGFGSAAAQDAVRLGFLQPTKSLLGQKAVQAVETAVAMINEAGGILGGRTVELVVYDDNFSPVDGVAATQRLISQDGVKLMAGGLSSTVALAMIPVLEADNALFVASVPKHTDVTQSGYEHVYRLNSTAVMDAKVFNAFLAKEVQPQELAFIGENNDFGRQNLEVIKELLSESGGKVAYEGFYDTKQSDFNSMVTDAKASGADTLFLTGANVEQYANIARSAAELGYSPENLVLAAGTLNNDFVKFSEGNAEGAVSVDIYIPTFDNEMNRNFVAKFQEMHGFVPEKIEELNFEAIWILANAIEKAGSTEVAQVSEAIRNSTWETPRGTVTFDDNGQAQSEAFVISVVDGKIVRP